MALDQTNFGIFLKSIAPFGFECVGAGALGLVSGLPCVFLAYERFFVLKNVSLIRIKCLHTVYVWCIEEVAKEM